MSNLIDLKLFQDYLENIGLKKDGFLKKILQVGFNGIVDLLMEDEFLILTKFKLKDGKILEGTFQQLKKIVKKAIQDAEKDKDRLFYNGLTILIDKEYQSPKK